MQRKRNILTAAMLVFCLLLGFAAPFLSTRIQDMRRSSFEPLIDGGPHYVYQGTLLNRVLAFNAHLNNSPAIEEIDRSAVDNFPNTDILWNRLCEFLPIEGSYDSVCERFMLAPKQYSAQYQYIALEYSQSGMTISAVIDEQSSLPIRIELKCSPQIMTDFLDKHDTWALLYEYTDLLNLGEPADVYYSKSAILVSRQAPIRGSSYSAEMTAMPSAGVLLFKLTGTSE